ncbi:MAG: hypothetical protein ACI8XB_002440 [Patiriisocius sp.]
MIVAPINYHAQVDSSSTEMDEIILLSDSIIINTDSLTVDSTKSGPIDEVIQYPALDSTVYDIHNQIVKMYNQAKVTYGDITLEADFIAFDFKNNEVLAYGTLDSLGNPIGRPIFAEGDQAFRSDTIKYNFETKEGLISAVKTNDNESYIHAEKSKRHSNEQIHNLWGKYTTCSNDKPHYHFRFKKMIVVPDKTVVTGPVFMKVGNVPTPLALPFGFFPNSDKQKAGVLIPSYGESGSLGFYLTRGGYYIPIGNNFDTKITVDLYARGTWGFDNNTRYVSKYKYSGGLNISFDSRIEGNAELNTDSRLKTFNIGWQHRQDPKASTNRTFSAKVNLGSIQKDRNNFTSSTDNYVQNNSNSTISYSKSWQKMQISSTATHNQNLGTGLYAFTLPSINFTLNRFFLPTHLISGSKTGSKWYDKIAVNYSSTLDNKLRNVTESELGFNKINQLSDNVSNGVLHNINTSASLKAGPFSIVPSISYRQRWHFKRNEKFLNQESLTYDNDTIDGFWMTDDVSLRANVTTKVFGLFQFNGDRIKAIRHVITPSIGVSYSPESDFNIGGFQQDSLSFDEYNPYSLSVYNQGNLVENGSVTMSLMNNLEMKVRDRKDTTGVGFKKMGIIDNFSLSSAYNLLADSLNLSNIRLTARTKLFKNIDINYQSSYRPYELNSEGRTINVFTWSNGKFPTLINNSLGINFRFRGGNGQNKSKDITPIPSGDPDLDAIERNRDLFVDFNVPWSFNASYTFGRANAFSVDEGFVKTDRQDIRSNGDVRLFEKWKIGYNGAYSFQEDKVTNLNLTLHWDLHCWEFVAGYIPIGTRKSYNLQLNVKASVLQDLKLQRRRDIDENNFVF